MLLKILTVLRITMTQDVPDVFEGTVEAAEIYFSGQWRNKRVSVMRQNAQSK
jgi:hypothetical protein